MGEDYRAILAIGKEFDEAYEVVAFLRDNNLLSEEDEAFNKMEEALFSERINRERKYFQEKSELYQQKHAAETEIKSIWNRFYQSADGRRLKHQQDVLKEVKNQIASMDRREFGYTHNLFSMLEQENN